MKEFLGILTEYVSGERPCSAVEEWLAGVDWDDPDLTQDGRNILGLFEVLATEVSESMRDESELVREAKELLAEGNDAVLDGITNQSQKELV